MVFLSGLRLSDSARSLRCFHLAAIHLGGRTSLCRFPPISLPTLFGTLSLPSLLFFWQAKMDKISFSSCTTSFKDGASRVNSPCAWMSHDTWCYFFVYGIFIYVISNGTMLPFYKLIRFLENNDTLRVLFCLYRKTINYVEFHFRLQSSSLRSWWFCACAFRSISKRTQNRQLRRLSFKRREKSKTLLFL